MENTVLKISHLKKHLGSRLILNDISVEVNAGEIFGFLGPNGSGKTTTIKVMLGLLSLEEGEVSICGYDIKKDFEKAMAQVGGIIENPELYGYLSGYENLMQVIRMHDGIPKSRIDEVVSLVKLTDRINDKVSKYSLGMRQRLGLAQALLNKPKLLVLDEPTNGLDPLGIKELRDILTEVTKEEGTAVFISSHQLAELDLICDRFAIIDKGNLIAVRSMQEVRGEMNGVNIESFEVTVDQNFASKAGEILFRIKNRYEYDDMGKFTVTADLNAGGAGLNATVREFVFADIPIVSATPVKHSLEDAFVALTAGMNINGNTGVFQPQIAPFYVSPMSQVPFAPPADVQNNGGGEVR